MRWPWSKTETRETGSGYTQVISQLISATAAGSQHASATAALEAVAGALSRTFASAQVVAAPGIVAAVSPRCLAQIGRDLVRVGASLHVIRYMSGRLVLVPASTWYWEGGADPATWLCTATAYGPSGSSTWRVPMDSVVFVTWGSPTARPYHGLGPTTWAAETARLHENAERSLADEAGGPVAQLMPVPQDGGDGDDDTDPLASLKADIGKAKGDALLVETTAGGWQEGKASAPLGDWKQSRLGPMPPDAMIKLGDSAFDRVLAACGASPALFDDSDGTAKREALRQWHMGVVRPYGRLLATELTEKFAAPVTLKFDDYGRDLVSRAQVFSKLIAAEGMTNAMALAISGLMADGGDEAAGNDAS